jgi:hypothetical protein
MDATPLQWRRQISPRYGFVARGINGYYEIIEKGWSYTYIPDAPSHDETIQWFAATSFEDAKRRCERLRLEHTGAHRVLRPPTPPLPLPGVPVCPK